MVNDGLSEAICQLLIRLQTHQQTDLALLVSLQIPHHQKS